MIQEAIGKLVTRQALSEAESAAVAEDIMTGEATPAQIGAFLIALRLTGETVEALTGMARVMREKALHVETDGHLVDVVGTGGDGLRTFNVSTASALTVAAAGVRVAKHGNRAASGSVGAADILDANGVKLELSPEAVGRCIDEVGLGFMFAPSFHPAMRFAGPPRRELGVRTVFNFLGPLTNPAGALYQLLGVAQPADAPYDVAELMAHVLGALGTERSWVVRGDDGLDELTTTATSQVWEVSSGGVRHFTLTPEEVGLPRGNLADLQVDSVEQAQEKFTRALSGGDSPEKDMVLLNAAAALVVRGETEDLSAGVARARSAIDSGAALDKLRRLAELSQSLA